MATKAVALISLSLSCLFTTAAHAGEVDPARGCAKNPAVVGQCFAVDGRVRVYNGSPAVRIWPKGSHRLLGVLPSEEEIMPDDLKKAISPDTDAFAQLTVCPFSKDQAGKMQYVCVEAAQGIRSSRRQ